MYCGAGNSGPARGVVGVGVEYRVTFYRTANGDKPLGAWLNDLKQQQPMLADLVRAGLDKLRDSAQHKPKLVELVDRNRRIYEMRVGNANIARVFFFREGDQVIATNGYVKRRNQLDQGELERARRYQDEWKERNP